MRKRERETALSPPIGSGFEKPALKKIKSQQGVAWSKVVRRRTPKKEKALIEMKDK